MTVGVSHSFGGTVVVVDLHTGLRFDLSPAQAMIGADICDQAADRPADMHIVIIPGLDDRALKWAGAPDDLHAMARDLRHHAKEAAAKAASNDAVETVTIQIQMKCPRLVPVRPGDVDSITNNPANRGIEPDGAA